MAETSCTFDASRWAIRAVTSVLPLSTMVTSVRKGNDSSRYRLKVSTFASSVAASL